LKPVPYQQYPRRGHRVVDIFHHVVCRHQVEVEVWPPQAEVYFQDEKWVDPINTQLRFEAAVFNSAAGVSWEVRDLAGNPGAGSIDASGLYQAPPKGSLPSGFTDIVVATATEDPLRKAFAWVTLLGEGPEPAPAPSIEIWPKRAYLYYPQGQHNSYIDDSNKMQLFRTTLRNSATSEVDWLVNGVVQGGIVEPWFLYKVSGSGATQKVTIRARIKNQPTVYDEAKVIQINYFWPGL
jgi:hypothetical protein